MEKIATLKDRLKKAMLDISISAAELSKETGISLSLISHYKSGRQEPKHEKLELLSKALDVDTAWLMGYDVPCKTVKQSEYFQEKLNRLTDEGKRKVEEYIDDLLDNPKYNKVPAVSLPPKLPKIA